MIEFRQVELHWRQRFESVFRKEEDRGCEYTFGNVYIWKDYYATQIALLDDSEIIVRFNRQVEGYLFPCGIRDLQRTIEQMITDSEQRAKAFRLVAVSSADVEQLQQLFPGRFLFSANRDFSEYVYNSSDLIQLAGKRYHSKRNHISRFISEYPDYTFEEITPENIREVQNMSEQWYKEALSARLDESLIQEKTATDNAIRDHFRLGFSGLLIRAAGRVIAFAMGEPVNDRTFCVHIEKALSEINGAYAIINRDYAAHFCPEYAFINREDDVGQQGLRRSKLSYHPAYLIDKYIVTLAQDPFKENINDQTRNRG